VTTVPSYAIVGHPNEGKSSIVATLAEDDTIRISDLPGETRRCRGSALRLNGETCINFVDTPGFQNPRRVEGIFREAVEKGLPPLEAFFTHAEGDAGLAHDRELLGPLAEGMGIIYVADGSRPPTAVDRAEIEILRLTGLPRIAVLNRKGGRSQWINEWTGLCQRAFNATREFNAHDAPFDARLRFIENLRVIDAANEKHLESVIAKMKTDRARRMEELAFRLQEWIGDALHYKHIYDYDRVQGVAGIREKVQAEYWKALEDMEQTAWRDFRRLLKHHRVEFDLSNDALLAEGIASEQTWQLLGLTRRQLTLAAAVIGAGGGAVADLATAGLTFGIFTAGGAVGGAASVWLFGDRLPAIKVAGLRLSSDRCTAGPAHSPQFPFILLDRALLYLQLLLARTHARRDPLKVDDEGKVLKQGILAQLPDAERKALARWIRETRQRRDRATDGDKASAVRTWIRDLLE